MDKTISLIITASVVLVAGLIVISMGTSSLTDFGSSADNIKDQGCEFQQQRVEDDPNLDEGDLSDRCQDNNGG